MRSAAQAVQYSAVQCKGRQCRQEVDEVRVTSWGGGGDKSGGNGGDGGDEGGGGDGSRNGGSSE
jgi:hypothetical protein